MIAYEDLVAALSHWRMNQGLPTGPIHFLNTNNEDANLNLPAQESPALHEGEEVEDAYGEVVEYEHEDSLQSEELLSNDVELVAEEEGDEEQYGLGLDYGDETQYEASAAPEEMKALPESALEEEHDYAIEDNSDDYTQVQSEDAHGIDVPGYGEDHADGEQADLGQVEEVEYDDQEDADIELGASGAESVQEFTEDLQGMEHEATQLGIIEGQLDPDNSSDDDQH